MAPHWPPGKPAIASITTNPDGSLHLTGTLFNGLCQGAAYGDDEQEDSNYPLVRFTDASGNVRYGRTHNWSSTAVMTGNMIVSTDCTIPAGASRQDDIQVVANGIASAVFVTPAPPPQIEVLNGATVITNNQVSVISFASVLQGQPGPSISFTVSNTGGANLNVTNITVPSGFTLLRNLPSSIPAGGSGGFVVQLNSTVAGTNSGDIAIQNNDPSNNPFAFPVTGLVNPKMIALGGTVSYGLVPLGSFAQGSLIISNLGHATLTVSNISYPSSAFSGDWSGAIPPGENQMVPVTFSPALPANYSGTVTVSSSAANGDNTLPVTAFGANSNLVLTVIAVGGGTVAGAPRPAAKVLAPGTKIMLKAVPGKGTVFSNWVGSYNSFKNPLSFSMTTNTIVQANFITNPFVPFAGTYNGLFTAASGVVAETNAGMLKGLTVTSKGTYSGSLLIDGQTHALTGAFNVGLQASNSIAIKAPEGPLELLMTLTSNDPAPQVTGIVSNSSWLSTNLIADRAAETALSPAYTVLIPPDPDSLSAPIGSGYALIAAASGTASTPATAKITGALADGATFSQSAPVSVDGYVPIFASLYSGEGLLLGWVNLANPSGDSLAWVHPKVKTGLFTNPFTSINPIALSPWTDPPAADALPTGMVVVETSNNTPVATNDFTLTFAGRTLNFSGTSGSTSVSGSIAAKTGLMKVTITSGKSETTGYSVVLPNAANGGGCFLTKTNAGAIELTP